MTGVVSGGSADDAGVRGGSGLVSVEGIDYCLGGDVVTTVAGAAVDDAGDLQRLVGGHEPGEAVTLRVVRSDGSTARLRVTLGTQPTTPPQTTTGCG